MMRVDLVNFSLIIEQQLPFMGIRFGSKIGGQKGHSFIELNFIYLIVKQMALLKVLQQIECSALLGPSSSLV